MSRSRWDLVQNGESPTSAMSAGVTRRHLDKQLHYAHLLSGPPAALALTQHCVNVDVHGAKPITRIHYRAHVSRLTNEKMGAIYADHPDALFALRTALQSYGARHNSSVCFLTSSRDVVIPKFDHPLTAVDIHGTWIAHLYSSGDEIEVMVNCALGYSKARFYGLINPRTSKPIIHGVNRTNPADCTRSVFTRVGEAYGDLVYKAYRVNSTPKP